MALAIKVEGVSKRYRLGEFGRRKFFSDLRRKLTGAADTEEFWALRDVSFDVREGDVLGVLGRNGAGKSTLLKILSAITAPTTGRIRVKGRMASLLEVGTGFHMELTGRDNIFLNGTILGMSRGEVAAKLDEIIAFSGVEKFLDTPVKRYSSGMRVRLAFAVAAHLEPEILVADEVLAVGDAAFQQRCLGQLDRVSKSGRTVLFVSHNSAAVASLCKRGVVLDGGRLVFDGTQTEALDYYGCLNPVAVQQNGVEGVRAGSGEVQITGVELRAPGGKPLGTARSGQDIELWLRFRRNVAGRWPGLCVRVHVETEFGTPVFVQFNDLSHARVIDGPGELPASGAFVCSIPALPLAPALYHIETEIRTARRQGETLDRLTPAMKLIVEKGDFFGTGELPNARLGAALVNGQWRMESDLA